MILPYVHSHSLVTQYRYSQPLFLPGQYQPQQLAFGPPPLPLAHNRNGYADSPEVNNNRASSGNMNFALPQYLLSNASESSNATALTANRAFQLYVMMPQLNAYEQTQTFWTQADSFSHVAQENMVGAVQCDIMLNGMAAHCVADTGSGISLISEIQGMLLLKQNPDGQVAGPLSFNSRRAMLEIEQAWVVRENIIGLDVQGICGVIALSFNSLLGMDFLRHGFPETDVFPARFQAHVFDQH